MIEKLHALHMLFITRLPLTYKCAINTINDGIQSEQIYFNQMKWQKLIAQWKLCFWSSNLTEWASKMINTNYWIAFESTAIYFDELNNSHLDDRERKGSPIYQTCKHLPLDSVIITRCNFAWCRANRQSNTKLIQIQ